VASPDEANDWMLRRHDSASVTPRSNRCGRLTSDDVDFVDNSLDPRLDHASVPLPIGRRSGWLAIQKRARPLARHRRTTTSVAGPEWPTRTDCTRMTIRVRAFLPRAEMTPIGRRLLSGAASEMRSLRGAERADRFGALCTRTHTDAGGSVRQSGLGSTSVKVGRPLLLVIGSLSPGGSERVITTMANYWAARDRQVTLATLAEGLGDHYSVDPRVRRLVLGKAGISSNKWIGLARNVRRVWALRNTIRAVGAPVVISFGDRVNVVTLLAGLRTGTRLIVSERVDPRHHPLSQPWGWMRRWTYRRAYRLVVQTDGLLPWASTLVGADRCCVIENPAPQLKRGAAAAAQSGTTRTMLAVGRLDRQKGFDVLLRAFALVAPEFSNWHLVILGEGDERPRLSALAHQLGIADRVSLPGVVSDPERVMADSHLFVLSSRYEGFPNALLEAMACGMPVVSTDCPSGPREIIRDGLDGLLVPVDDPVALAHAMGSLMGDEHARAALGQRAQSVCERFGMATVMGKWERLIDGDGPGRGE
jgi:GalNAc-alpha-(1->4)-GalNAc-alpha-(1->3)-diNAcBac-PP-undecaprenol alpha-1,4-N-acetyl-D-galactosaminyltransferase